MEPSKSTRLCPTITELLPTYVFRDLRLRMSTISHAPVRLKLITDRVHGDDPNVAVRGS
jgi:hypothetical protein